MNTGMNDTPLAELDDRFLDALTRAWKDQYRWCTIYRRRCDTAGVSEAAGVRRIENGDLMALPALESGLWKRSCGIFRELSRPGEGGSWAISSSTSGDPSFRWYTREDVDEVNSSFMRAFNKIPAAVDTLALLTPSLQELERFSSQIRIGDEPVFLFMTHPIRSSLSRFGQIQFISRTPGKTPQEQGIDMGHLSRVLRKAHADREVIVLGYSVLFIKEALRHREFRQYSFNDRLYVVTGGGGWNGVKGDIEYAEVGKPEFVTAVARALGLSDVERQVIDIYGTAETGKAHSGYYCRRLGDYAFETDSAVKLYVVDPVHGEPVERGESGIPRWISPYGVQGSASVVVDQDDDRVTVESIGPAGSVTRFTHVNRAPTGSESEMAEWMEREWDGCPVDLLEMAAKVMMK